MKTNFRHGLLACTKASEKAQSVENRNNDKSTTGQVKKKTTGQVKKRQLDKWTNWTTPPLEDKQQQKQTLHAGPDEARSAHTEPKQHDGRQRQLWVSKDDCQKPPTTKRKFKTLGGNQDEKNAKATTSCATRKQWKNKHKL